jgi:hypothetical protein
MVQSDIITTLATDECNETHTHEIDNEFFDLSLVFEHYKNDNKKLKIPPFKYYLINNENKKNIFITYREISYTKLSSMSIGHAKMSSTFFAKELSNYIDGYEDLEYSNRENIFIILFCTKNDSNVRIMKDILINIEKELKDYDVNNIKLIQYKHFNLSFFEDIIKS